MKKLIGNKYLLILNLVLLLIGGSLLIYKNNEIKSYKEEMVAPDVDPNYDKMKISYVNIKERKTGLPTFDSVSDMDGHDASETDNYVRTSDTITYIVEVGIERNENTTTPTEVLKGGKIKVKATIPPDQEGKYYIHFLKDSWMQSYSNAKPFTNLTATYIIPADKTPVGGTQQLSFTLVAIGHEKVLTSDQLPIFEVWMEGNKPDNENSLANSVTRQDTTPLTITGRVDARLDIRAGKVNAKAEYNGVQGQFINFFTREYSPSGKGYDDPVNKLSSSLKIQYRYKNLDENTDWVDLATIDGVNPVNNTILYSYGRPCETTEGYWPSSDGNTIASLITGYCASYTSGGVSSSSLIYAHNYDSGVMSAIQSDDGVNIDFSNTGFYTNNSYTSNTYKTLAAQGFEIFVPWYEPTPGRYQYEITITDTSLTVEDQYGEEYNTTPNKSIKIYFYNELTGDFSYDLRSGMVFTDVTELPMGNKKYFDSVVNVTDGPYEGGIEKLEVWNSKYVDFVPDSSHPSIYYSNSGPFDVPSKVNAKMQFGLYKNDISHGITSDDQVNASKFDDFIWYDTYQEAMENGVITAVRTDEPDWRGYNCSSYIYDIYLRPKEDLSNVGKTGIIRFWAWIYADEARTQVYKIGDGIDYISAVVNEQGTGLSTYPSPTGIGQTFIITGISISVSTTNTDMIGNTIKPNYNVEEEIINMSITPRFSAGIENITGNATFIVEASIPKDLSYIPGSSNLEPTSVTTNSSGVTTVIWEFNDWNLADSLPLINYQLEISPYTANNVSKGVYAYISSPSVLGSKKSSSTSFTITNLAGSSLRKILSKDKVERNELVDITDYLYNIAQSRLINFKTVEILPKNGDNLGTHYSGTYTMEVVSLADTQKMFYTTNSIDNIGLTTDSVGKPHIQTVDLENDSRWIEVHAGDTIPSNATAIASLVPEVAAQSDINYKLKFIPSGNTYADVYYFQLIGSSDNLENAISSEIKQVSVIDRKISGIVFLDKNHNGKYDSNTDELLSNKTVKMYDSENNVVREMTTDENGYYESSHFDRGSYYIQYELSSHMEFIDKNVGASNVSSVINKNTGKSDIIQEFSQNPTAAIIWAQNKNVGIQYEQAQVITHHYLVGTTTKVHDDVTENTYFNSNYSTTSIATGDLYDEYANKYKVTSTTGGAPVSGTVNSETVEVIYYYEQRPGQVIAHHYLVGTTTKVHDDVTQSLHYGDPYNTERLTLSSYVEAGVDGDPVSGTVNKDAIEVIYYYRLKTSVITVHHYVEGTTTKVHDDNTINKNYTEPYETNYYQSNELSGNYKNNYRYKRADGDPVSGTVSKDTYEIIYYYELKPATITVHHYIDGTTTKVHNDDTYNKLYTQPYETNYYASNELDGNYKNNYKYKRSEGDAVSGTVSKDTYEVIYYYELKPATVTVHHYIDGTTTKVHNDDTYNKLYTEPYETNYYASNELDGNYKNNYKYKRADGDAVSGTISKDTYEVIYYYELKPATVTVHHYIEGTTTKVHSDDTYNKLYTQPYETNYYSSDELEGNYKNNYKYKSRSGDAASGTVNKDTYEVIYYYELKPATVTVHHYIDGTTTKVHNDDTYNKLYTQPYETNYYQSSELDGNYKTNYKYKRADGDAVSGTVSKDTYEVIYYYELKPATITVHHYVKDTETKVHDDDIINKLYTENYQTNYYEDSELDGDYKNNYKYNNNHSGDSISGTVNKDSYEIIYYYEAKTSIVTVHHYIKGTETQLHDDDVINTIYGVSYETNSYPSNELTDSNYYYNDVHGGDDSAGIINKDSYVVTYYYELRPAKVTVHHYILDTTTEVHPDDIIHTHYGETYNTNYYETLDLNLLYKGLYIYNEVHSGDDITGTINKDEYEVTYFYNLRPAQITVHHYIEDTTTKLCDDKVLDLKYTDSYEVDSCLNLSDANYTYKNVINTGNGEQTGSKITGNILEDSIEITYYYTLKPGRIVVHYIESGTDRRLTDDIIGEGLVTQEYTHEPKEFEGYKLVKSPESNKITFKEDTQEVFYEYEKLKYNIEVQVSGGVGEITGEEIVYYGDDSTKDYIVITPGDGYEIESLSVNGKEVGLISRDKQTLENLKGVKEDYLIQVSFREKVIPVPITDKSSNLIVVALIFIALNLIGFFYFKFRHNN